MAAYWNIIEILEKINGATFLGIDTLTDVSLTGGKKNPYQGRVTKRVFASNVMAFQNKNINGYEAMVRRRLKAEGKDADDFQLGPRVWGTRLPGLPLVEHNGKYYLEVIFIKAGQVQYLLDGSPVDPSKIEGMKERKESEGQGGLENKVIIRTYALESITAITVGGEWYPGKFEV